MGKESASEAESETEQSRRAKTEGTYKRICADPIPRETGTYDPIPKAPVDGEGKPFKDIKLDSARAKYWLGVGAQPSDPAWRLLSMVSYLTTYFLYTF